jgi:hypothetical protein
VLATVEGADPPTVTVARRALVVDAGDEGVTVAVTVDETPRVAFAATGRGVTLVLLGAP